MHAVLFGEDQARYICTVAKQDSDMFETAAKADGAPIQKLGVVSGGDLKINESVSISIATLRDTHESWFPEYMNGNTAKIAAE